ncbi:hypothetical protein Q4485_07375 [Granulosicoccaceae sp. 1_MG-2023]|nr:hypothetical protein [Granulosicoccaceae sp. 1_MG-2023]
MDVRGRLSKAWLPLLIGLVLSAGVLTEISLFARLADGLAYFVRERRVSPQGVYEVTRFVAAPDTGHAPGGQYLVLAARRGITHPRDGHIMLAGYCDRPLRYGWQDELTLWWYCPFAEARLVTYSPLARGLQLRERRPAERGLFRFP